MNSIKLDIIRVGNMAGHFIVPALTGTFSYMPCLNNSKNKQNSKPTTDIPATNFCS